MKSTSKIKFSHYLLSNDFNDKLWRYHLDIPYLSTYHNNKGHHEFKQSN
jgi:hypothetical protein